MQHPDTKLCNRVNMIIRDGILVKTVRYVRVQSLSFHAYRIYSIKRRRSDGSKITNKRRPGIHAAPNQKNAARIIIVNLSKDVFERRTSTGSGLFSFLDSGFAHLLGQLVSIIVKTLRNTNLGASRCFKMKKTSLPVDVRRSKTPLLKLH